MDEYGALVIAAHFIATSIGLVLIALMVWAVMKRNEKP
jgi:hypothetical protein